MSEQSPEAVQADTNTTDSTFTSDSGTSFSLSDAEAAGWRIVHEAVDYLAEDATGNSALHRAEKYHSPAGVSASLLNEVGETVEKLLERIFHREQQLGQLADNGSSVNTVTLPAPGVEGEADVSDPSQIEQVSDDVLTARAQNDVVTVLSDPTDPESEPVQKIVVAGEETDPEALNESNAPESATLAEVQAGHQAAIDKAVELRDSDTAAEADGPDAVQAVENADAQAQQDTLDEKVQASDGTATNASDSEQQSQVPDAEAASSDAISTNADDGLAQAGQTGPDVFGPSTDSEAPAPAPNAHQGDAPAQA